MGITGDFEGMLTGGGYAASLTPRESSLLRAVRRGDYGLLAYLLGSSSNGKQREGSAKSLDLVGALLIEASSREHLDCIELLLQKMMTPNPRRNLKQRGYFPMHKAASTGAIESIELLLSAGLSPKTRDHSGRTPLHFAAVQGSAECVSFLCTIARSTVMSHDRANGDTPLHFAVRARHGVCIEVLLSHAKRDRDILREANAMGATPLDIASALNDRAILWALRDGEKRWRQRHSRADDTSLAFPPETKGRKDVFVDIERIMAVWGRFFENAALACVGERDQSHVPRGSSVDRRTNNGETRRDRNSYSLDTVTAAEEGRSAERGLLQPTTDFHEKQLDRLKQVRRSAWVLERSDEGISTSSSKTATMWDEKREGAARGQGEGGDTTQGHSAMDLMLSHLPQDPLVAVGTPHTFAWKTEPTDSTLNQEGGTFDGLPLPVLAPRDRKGNSIRTQFDSGALSCSSNDPELSHFHTPRGGDDQEAGWLSRIHTGQVDNALERPPSGSERRDAGEKSEDMTVDRHRSWVACWDDTSESIYYWNLESKEVSWTVPPCYPAITEDGQNRFPDHVWDPKWEAFFAIDQDGNTHWVESSPSSPMSMSPLLEPLAASGSFVRTTVSSARDVTCKRTDISTDKRDNCALWQHGFGEVLAASGGSSLSDKTDVRENCNVASALSEDNYTENLGLQMTPISVADADSRADEYEFYETGEQLEDMALLAPPPESKSEHDGLSINDAWVDFRCGGKAGEGQTSTVRTDGESVAHCSKKITAEREKLGSVEFFDTSTYDDRAETNNYHEEAFRGKQTSLSTILPPLSAWVLWCAAPCGDGDDSPSYFINENTSKRSWVIPPEAVAASGGWLRAWSEEHQSWFYANHWTGRVTWELQDLEGWSKDCHM